MKKSTMFTAMCFCFALILYIFNCGWMKVYKDEKKSYNSAMFERKQGEHYRQLWRDCSNKKIQQEEECIQQKKLDCLEAPERPKWMEPFSKVDIFGEPTVFSDTDNFMEDAKKK
ncbi:MAG: hypothetical protein KAR20_29240 [Candidatus Heimdallarchaeota archaeon]|nr:hypothetical protein [Candidatus Heimdallarchaeota archaeon]